MARQVVQYVGRCLLRERARMELRWIPNIDVSAIHAAWVLSSGRSLLDSNFAEKVAGPAAELAKLASSWHASPNLFWRQLLGMAADLPVNAELVDRLYRRLAGGSPGQATASHAASVLAQCKAVFRQALPKALEELQLRVGPLQLAWEARGPGLMAMIKRSTEEGFLVESAGVVLVQPVVGGDGLAHLYCNRAHLEAVLTNVEPRLPETLRLAWMLGQLNLDRPFYSDRVHGHVLGEVAELALMPVVLAAAEEVELARLTTETLQLSLEQWTRTPTENRQQLAETLMAWWETATEGQWDWNTRLAALSQML